MFLQVRAHKGDIKYSKNKINTATPCGILKCKDFMKLTNLRRTGELQKFTLLYLRMGKSTQTYLNIDPGEIFSLINRNIYFATSKYITQPADWFNLVKAYISAEKRAMTDFLY